MEIIMLQKIMEENDKISDYNREFLRKRRLMAVNIMASPGAGKTSVIMALIAALRDKLNIAVIEGDIASSIDAQTVEDAGIEAIQINTGGACHLDANMIRAAYDKLRVCDGIIFIENVGNLICPHCFNLGEDVKLVIASVPEGHDKTFKYITMFEAADVVVLNKSDLEEYIGFDYKMFEKGLRAVNQNAPLLKTDCRNNIGIIQLANRLLTKYNNSFGEIEK